jgi:glucose-6-phosphate isomerase
MTQLLEPFTALVDLRRGRVEPRRDVVERRLSDMRGMYLEKLEGDRDPLIYTVYGIPVPETNDNVMSSTTVLEPGTVGREFYMTKGHYHEVRDRAEVYVTFEGEGRLVMATEQGQVRVEGMRPGTVNYVPGGWAHRSVNVGDRALVFFAAYVADAGHDYGSIEERGFPVLVVAGEDGAEVVVNPGYRG